MQENEFFGYFTIARLTRSQVWSQRNLSRTDTIDITKWLNLTDVSTRYQPTPITEMAEDKRNEMSIHDDYVENQQKHRKRTHKYAEHITRWRRKPKWSTLLNWTYLHQTQSGIARNEGHAIFSYLLQQEGAIFSNCEFHFKPVTGYSVFTVYSWLIWYTIACTGVEWMRPTLNVICRIEITQGGS